MAFFKLLTGGNVFAPEPLGEVEILIAGDRIGTIAEKIELADALDVERIDLGGMTVTPGFIDLHVHITGGGGEAGPASRLPEIKVEAILAAGVTTVLGVLGTDAVTRSTEALVAKAQGLEQEGITAYALSGSYTFPNLTTLTGSLQKDVALIPQIVGVGELALSDHRGPQATFAEFVRMVADARVGGLIGGKPGLAVVHMGGGKAGMAKLFKLVAETDIPISSLLPTHVTRTVKLFEESIKYAALGGNIDITALEDQTSERMSLTEALDRLRTNHIPLDRVTVSSDSNGSLPHFDENGQLVGMKAASIDSLTQEFGSLACAGDLPIHEALALFSTNPAARLGLGGEKGIIAPSACADIAVFDRNWRVDTVLAKGALRLRSGRLVKGGYFA